MVLAGWFTIDSSKLHEVRSKGGTQGTFSTARDDEGFTKVNFPSNLSYEDALAQRIELGKAALGVLTTMKGFAVGCRVEDEDEIYGKIHKELYGATSQQFNGMQLGTLPL